jgi:hypothetical protein
MMRFVLGDDGDGEWKHGRNVGMGGVHWRRRTSSTQDYFPSALAASTKVAMESCVIASIFALRAMAGMMRCHFSTEYRDATGSS